MQTSRFVLPTGGFLLLTEKQLTTLRYLATGDSNEQIAAASGLSLRGVRSRVSATLEALGVRNRTEAVIVAMWGNILIPSLPARTPARLTRIERQRIRRQNRAS